MTDHSVIERAARHRWPKAGEPNYRSLVACIDGNDRTERVCLSCGLVKITVHPPKGFAWREWRTRDGKPWVGDITPPCLGIDP
jgi:hypothetical protein